MRQYTRQRIFPQQPPTYTRPTSDTSDLSDGGDNIDEDEMIPVSFRAIREICAGIDLASLPEQLRDLIARKDNGDNTLSHRSQATVDPGKKQTTEHQSGGQGPHSDIPTQSQEIGAGICKNINPPHVSIGVLTNFVNSEAFATQVATQIQSRNKEPHIESAPTPKKRSPKGKKKLNQPRDRAASRQNDGDKNEKLRHGELKRNPTCETKDMPTPRQILSRDPKKNAACDPKPPRALVIRRKTNASEAAQGPFKRKAAEITESSRQPKATTSRMAHARGKEKPPNNLNPEGFFEVRVEYD